jgi:hypothetical protein
MPGSLWGAERRENLPGDTRCVSERPDRMHNDCRGAAQGRPASEPSGKSQLPILGRQNRHHRLFQPARARPENFRRFGALRRSVDFGANKATWLVTTANLTANGTEIPAGGYSLFAIPNPDSWTLIINKTSRDAIGGMSYYPGKDSDLARLPLTISKLPAKQEDFTISFVPGGSSCALRFDWDLTRASTTLSEKK